jgi:DNA-binding NarL/FixJ family response regulator
MIRVFLVDDHAVVRRGMRAFFDMLDDIQVLGEAADGPRWTSWPCWRPATTCPTWC